MRTVIHLRDRAALLAYVGYLLKDYREVEEEDLIVSKYGYDPRIDWHTLLVSVRDYGVVGFATEVPG